MLSVKHIAARIVQGWGYRSGAILGLCYAVFLLLLPQDWDRTYLIAILAAYAVFMPAVMILDWIAWFRRGGPPNA
jgi:hypothetical protein